MEPKNLGDGERRQIKLPQTETSSAIEVRRAVGTERRRYSTVETMLLESSIEAIDNRSGAGRNGLLAVCRGALMKCDVQGRIE